MGRFLTYGTIAVLAVFVLSATFLLQSGGESIASVQRVSVHDLTTSPQRYRGDPITTQGVLTYSDEHERYQVVEDGNYALVVREYHGHSSLEALVDKDVRISGVFDFNDDLGVYIDADFVVALLEE